MQLKQSPEILYKYRAFTDLSILMLQNKQLYFAGPLEFNDPFDCVAQEYMFDEIRENSLELLALLHPHIEPCAITPQSIARMITAIKQHPQIIKIKTDLEQQFKKHIETIGILSLSECNDSILMWSHYANYHRGFCVGFKKNIGYPSPDVQRVIYSSTRKNDLLGQFISMQAIADADRRQKLMDDFILTKYIDWQYEKEWRIIGNKGLVNYSDEHIDRIIFGVNMPIIHREKIYSLFDGKRINFFQAVKSKRHFAIEIEEYNKI